MTSENTSSSSDLPATEAVYQEPTWEDDETRATGILRALFTIVATGFLAYAQWTAPASWSGAVGQNWGRWVWMSAVCNFALPLGIVWMFFGQVLSHQEWLKDQKHNAWNYGWNFKNWRYHLKISLLCWALFLPFLIYFSRQPEMRAAYATYLPTVGSPRDWAFLLSTLVLYMFCWEWFFRGFALFGIAQGLGIVAAIIIQAAIFGLSHYGKPDIEMWSAFAGGIVLGTLAWREKSFFPAFLIHALIHVTWAVLVLI
ncbi:MAG: CPBP family intramembrane metalloprotease [Armatimonadetes bacterium]|nr:CPBP family intramembrane metalloprotease [Armatimonadota bacterium]